MSEEYPLGPRLAGAIYEAQAVQQRCEDVILGAIHDFMAKGDCEFKRFDYYDTSIEFWCKPGVELSELDQGALRVLGFSRCWVCYRESKDGEWVGPELGERYYSLVRASSPQEGEKR